MSIDTETKAQFTERASTWMNENNPKFFNWTLGDPKPVKGAYYNKDKGRSDGLPNGLVVPILCETCGSTIAHYDELPDPPM